MYDTDHDSDDESDLVEICCIAGCDVQNDPDITEPVTFHKVPSRPLLLEKWMKLIGRKRKLPSDAHVCSLHFEPTCYSEDDRGRKCLKRSAVPTIKPKSETTPSQSPTKTPTSVRRPTSMTNALNTSEDEPSKTNSFPEGTQIVVLDKPLTELEQNEHSKSSRKIVVLLPAATEGGEPSETEDMDRSDSDFNSETESSPSKTSAKKKGAGRGGLSNLSKSEERQRGQQEDAPRGPSGRKVMKPGPNSHSRRKVLKPEPNRQKNLKTESHKPNNTSSGNEAYQLKKRIVELEKDNVKLQKVISSEKAKTKQLRDRVMILKQQSPPKQGNSRVIIAHVRF